MRARLWIPLTLLALGSGACTLLFGDYHVRTDGNGGGGGTTTGPSSTTSGSGGATAITGSSGSIGGGGNTGTTTTSGSTSTTTSAVQLANGAACGADTDCQSGHCFSGATGMVCCDQACTGGSPCTESCDLSVTFEGEVVSWVGQCLPVTRGLRGDCPKGEYCSQSNDGCTSKLPYGATCLSAEQCASARCRLNACESVRQDAGAPCLNRYGCQSDHCDPVTHLCQ